MKNKYHLEKINSGTFICIARKRVNPAFIYYFFLKRFARSIDFQVAVLQLVKLALK